MSIRAVLVALGIVIVVVAGSWGLWLRSDDSESVDVRRSASVTEKTGAPLPSLSEEMPTICVLMADHSMQVQSEVAGRLLKLHVGLGDDVEQGQVLAKVSEGKLPFQIEKARQALAEARLNYRGAQVRSRSARAKSDSRDKIGTIIAREEVESARADVSLASIETSNAASRIAAQASELESLLVELEKSEIRAPIGGTITFVYEQEGSLLGAGTVVMGISSKSLAFRCAGSVKVASQLRENDPVALLPDDLLPENEGKANQRVEGRVRRVAQMVDPTTGLVFIEGEVPGDVLAAEELHVGAVVRMESLANESSQTP